LTEEAVRSEVFCCKVWKGSVVEAEVRWSLYTRFGMKLDFKIPPDCLKVGSEFLENEEYDDLVEKLPP
jgi:hypothetical protein